MDGWMDGWMAECKHGWMNGITNKQGTCRVIKTSAIRSGDRRPRDSSLEQSYEGQPAMPLGTN
eukprot:scaffold185055_cov18-Prasinocladus_malaysianus.AAC.1